MTGDLIKKRGGNLETHNTKGEHHMKIKTEIEVMLPQARNCGQTTGGQGRGASSPSQCLEGTNPADTLVQDF